MLFTENRRSFYFERVCFFLFLLFVCLFCFPEACYHAFFFIIKLNWFLHYQSTYQKLSFLSKHRLSWNISAEMMPPKSGT